MHASSVLLAQLLLLIDLLHVLEPYIVLFSFFQLERLDSVLKPLNSLFLHVHMFRPSLQHLVSLDGFILANRKVPD